MRQSALICALVLIAVAGLATAAKRPAPPVQCRATAACTAPAPACIEGQKLFTCEESTGTWVGVPNVNGSATAVSISVDFTIGGPVRIDGDFFLVNKANLTFNESHSAVLTVKGHANFSQANETWTIRLSEADLDAMAVVEKSGSTDYSASTRRVFLAHTSERPDNWKLKLAKTTLCHVPSLVDAQPAWGTITDYQDGPWTSFTFQTKTKSQCWWWIVLVGVILIYFVALGVLIVLFRTVPALKKWTARPSFETHGPSTPVRLADENEYEMDYSHSTRNSQRQDGSDDTDSVRLDL